MTRTTRRQLFVGVGLVAGAGFGGLFRLAGSPGRGEPLLRPPGARPEPEFLAACVRCGQCVEVCPFGTLRLADLGDGLAAGTPWLDSRKVPCYLCRGEEELLCIAACPTGALEPVADERAIRMGVAVIDTEICWAHHGTICRTCFHACPFPFEAIAFDESLRPVVNPAVCIGCGLCDYACPTEPSAIPIVPASAEAAS